MGFFSDLWDRGKEAAQNVTSVLNPFNWMDYFSQKQASRQAEHQFWVTRNDALLADQANRDMAYEFAQHGVQWKAEDARAAGLSPLAAMGGSGAYSPTSYVNTPLPHYTGTRVGGGTNMSWGQAKLEQRLLMEQIRGLRIKNDAAERDLAGQADLPSGFGGTGPQAVVAPVKVLPDRVVTHKSGVTPGVHPAYKIIQHPDRSVTMENIEQREAEDAPLYWLQTEGKKIGMHLRGNMFERLSSHEKKKLINYVLDLRRNAPPGKWQWDLIESKFYPARGQGMFVQPLPVRYNGSMMTNKVRRPGLKRKPVTMKNWAKTYRRMSQGTW